MANSAKILSEIRVERLGLSMDDFAKLLGYKGASSVQRYFGAEFEDKPLSDILLLRMHSHLIGMGNPAITHDELYALGDVTSFLEPKGNNSPRHSTISVIAKATDKTTAWMESGIDEISPDPPNAIITGELTGPSQRIPVYGHAVAGEDGEFFLNGNLIYEVLAPSGLAKIKDAFGIIVAGDSMEPKFEDGDIAFVDPSHRVRRGNYVVAQIATDDESMHLAFVKRFVRHNSKELVLEQLNPVRELVFSHEMVVSVQCIVLSGIAGSC